MSVRTYLSSGHQGIRIISSPAREYSAYMFSRGGGQETYVAPTWSLPPPSSPARLNTVATFAPGGYEIALLAAGAAVVAADAVMDGRCKNAYVLMRPPGHHAERSQGMGFCIFNNGRVTWVEWWVGKFMLKQMGFASTASLLSWLCSPSPLFSVAVATALTCRVHVFCSSCVHMQWL